MKIHTKVRYGLRTMIELNKSDSTTGILQKDIADSQEIPIKYLDTIISGLKSAGLIINYAGKSSGYILAKQPDEISVYDIYRAFEPEITLVNCLCPGNHCDRIDICPAKDYWFELNEEIKKKMKSSMLSQL
jgi:Rrf2 family protein